MTCSVMTLSMFIRILYNYLRSQDMEECRELYEEMLQTTREEGWETVELTSRETRLLGTEYVRTTLREHGLKVGGYMHMDSLDDDPQELLKAVDTAQAVEADLMMLIPSWHASLEQLSRDEIHQRYASRWMEAAQKASQKGIRIVIEDTPDQRLHLCKAEDVGHFLSLLPSAGLVYDTGNMILAGEDPLAYASSFEGRIGCVHLKDMAEVPEETRGADCALDGRKMASVRQGQGVIPLTPIIDLLKKQGYTGRWVLELSMAGMESYGQAVRLAWSDTEKLLGHTNDAEERSGCRLNIVV